ncbi:INSulin related [Caenorhabditis elegans]|uniref:INSulin related n=1 Tax=Caenorhabditis elegans TaxID=6239 RepID=Q7YTH4_CAEEL|nr:INSulin related [Caenorhabditis elegans]CAE18046.2 INSulin related [Caenorhabditis elegans]|eukprot:NP_001255416.1 INSulin related [Caenorhabditis elegans]
MSPIILIFFLVFIPFSQQHTSLEESLNDRIISEEVVEMLSEKEIRPSRVRRVPEQKNKLCGKQVLSYVMALCEKACDSNTKVDIATKCCRDACSDEFIRHQCCP